MIFNTVAIVILGILGIMESRTYAEQRERIDEAQSEIQLLQGKVQRLEKILESK